MRRQVLRGESLANTVDMGVGAGLTWKALNRIQVQMAALNKEAGGYVLLNFSQLLDDELQVVMVGQNDLARVLELGAELRIKVEPALEALKVAVHS